MPVDIIDLGRLIFAIIMFIIPGYLWTYLISKTWTFLERVVAGFLGTIIIMSLALFAIELLIDGIITQSFIYAMYAVYTIPVFILYIIGVFRHKKQKQEPTHFLKDALSQKVIKIRQTINNKPLFFEYVLLTLVLCFVFYMTILSHLQNNYYLPFHVDEYINWSYSRSVIEAGSTSFLNSYTGVGIEQPLEIGLNLLTTLLSLFANVSFVTIFVFMPSILAITAAVIVYRIGSYKKSSVGLISAFFIAFIPTTCRFLGPSFYVASSFGLVLLAFTLWLLEKRNLKTAFSFLVFVPYIFIVHPPTALAALILIGFYSLQLLFQRKIKLIKLGLVTLGSSLLPILSFFVIGSRWNLDIEKVLSAASGQELKLILSEIWVEFDQLGIIIWVLAIIGTYFAIAQGKKLERTIVFSAFAMITAIGLYSKFDYGPPIFYERAFLYLYFLVVLLAAIGLTDLYRLTRKAVGWISKKRTIKHIHYVPVLVAVFVGFFVVASAVPVHQNIPYYKLITEQEYNDFLWIHDNIALFETENCSIGKGVIDPFKASAFSAVTGLPMVSSIMWPIYGYSKHTEVEQFLKNGCADTNFLIENTVLIVYTAGSCNNENLTMIHKNAYLYCS